MNDTPRPPGHRPGDIMLDRYFPDADEETRERARQAFSDFAHFLVRIGDRLEREELARGEAEKCSNSSDGLFKNENLENGEFGYYGA